MPAKGTWIEQVDKRTRNGKKRVDSADANHFAVDVTIGSVHYPDNGWQNIDNEFAPAVAPWDWEMLKAGYHIRVMEDFTAGQIIGFYKEGESVLFQPHALEWTNDLDQIQPVAMPHDVTPVITNPIVDLLPNVGMPSHQGTIRWNDGYGTGIDLEWKCTTTRLAKILEIDSLASLPVPEQYIIDGGNPVLRLNLIFDPSKDLDIYVDGLEWDKKVKIQTFNIIEFRKDGEVLWVFIPLRYWDSGEDNEGQSIATLEKRGNSLYISIRVPYGWLQAATFPVFIDVDVDEQVGASGDDWYYRRETSSFNAASTFAYVGDFSATFYDYETGGRFQTVAIPNAATIDVAYISVKAHSLTGVVATIELYGNDIDDAVAPTSTGEHEALVLTTAHVSWTPGAWVAATWYDSDSIVTIIAEITVRGGWATGQDLMVLLKHVANWGGIQARNRLYQWDDVAADALKLHVEYSLGGNFFQATGGGAVTMAGNLGLYTFIDVGEGAVTMGGVLGALKGFVQAVGGGAVTMAGGLVTVFKYSIAVGGGAVGLAGALGRAIATAVGAGAITPTGALALLTRIPVGAGAVGIAGALGRLTKIPVGSGAMAIAGVLGTVLTVGQLLFILSRIAQVLHITKSTATELIITSSIATVLTIKSSMAVR